MEDFGLHPISRVFRLDDECYVVYLGRDVEDYKPFLRVGTAHALPEDVRSLIYSIVVTDLLPGSPLLEQENIPTGHPEDFRYIGDPDTVERMKVYLRHTEIPSIGYEEAHEELEEQGAYAYFYDDGNLRLKVDKNEIFNLKRREERDLHYSERARQVKKLFQGSRTRYAVRNYESPGLFIAGNVPYLYSRGRFAALGTDENYFYTLAASGIDPDRVTAVVAPEASEGLVRLMKRVRGTSQLRILSEHPEAVRPIAELFAGDGKLALKYEITRLDSDKFIPLLDYRIRTRDAGYEVERSDSSLALHIGEKTQGADGLHIDPINKSWRFSQSGASAKGMLLQGALYRFYQQEPPELSKLIEDYLPAPTGGSRPDALSGAEDAAAGALTEFFRLASAGSDTQASIKSIQGALDNLRRDFSALFWVYMENVRTLASLLSARDEARRRSYRQVLSALPKAQAPPASSRFLPLVGEFYTTEAGAAVVLYRVTEMVTSDSLAFARELDERFKETTKPTDSEVFASERERLYELLASLDLVKARIPKHERTEEREQEEAARQAVEGVAKRSATTEKHEKKRAHAGETRKERRTRRRRTVAGIIAALVVVLLLGAGYLLYGPSEERPARQAQAGEDADGGAEPGPAQSSENGSEAQPGEDGGEVQSGEDGGESADGGDVESDATGESSEGTSEPGEPTEPAESGRPSESAEESDAAELAEQAELLGDIPGLEPRESVGGIVVTILDIIRMANKIAVDNGYRPMGAPEEAGPNPDWIFPGNEFTLPDGSTRTVTEGDTIWDIAADFIEKRLAVRYERYLEIVAEYEQGASDREEIVERLVSIRDSTYAENFESLVQQTIEEVRQGE